MWLDNLYLRAVAVNPPAERKFHYIGLVGSAALKWPLRGQGRRFMTRVTLQGDGLGPTTGLWADEATYAESAPPGAPPGTSHRCHSRASGRITGIAASPRRACFT